MCLVIHWKRKSHHTFASIVKKISEATICSFWLNVDQVFPDAYYGVCLGIFVRFGLMYPGIELPHSMGGDDGILAFFWSASAFYLLNVQLKRTEDDKKIFNCLCQLPIIYLLFRTKGFYKLRSIS